MFTFSGSCEKSVTAFVLGCDEMLENPFSLASLSSVVVCNQAYSLRLSNIQTIIDLPGGQKLGKSMTPPYQGNTFFFRSSQQLPILGLEPMKGFLSCHGTLPCVHCLHNYRDTRTQMWAWV